MKRACLLLRHAPHTKFKAFERGLKRLGYEVSDNSSLPRENDILLMWNRYHRNEVHAREYERVGGKVIVAENGWIGKIDGCKPIALCIGHHNGKGKWFVGETDRWSKCGIELQPWREEERGEHILLLPQRGFGEEGVKMPQGWLSETMKRVARISRRPILVRNHPGTEKPKDPDFSGAWCAITWASGAAIKALAAGIPVFYEMPYWLGQSAAREGIDLIERPFMPDRLPMFRRLAWAQWSPLEIETGEPFVELLNI